MKTKKKVKKTSVKKKQIRVSGSTVKRLSKYYRTLNELIKEDIDTISSEALAKLEGVTSAQIRKDFSFFGNFGRRGLGYNTQDLKTHIAGILGLNRNWNVAIIGAGNIGSALIDYAEFKAHGFHIKLVFDNDPVYFTTSYEGIKFDDLVKSPSGWICHFDRREKSSVSKVLQGQDFSLRSK